MKRRIVLINILMLMGILILAQQLVSGWEEFERAHSLQQVADKVQETEGTVDPVEIKPVQPMLPSSQFAVIAERNLFSEDRQMPFDEEISEGQEVVEEKPPVWKSRPVLLGVTSREGRKQALMTVFEGSDSRSEAMTVREGDVVQGYTVSEIAETTLTLRWKGRKELIDMADAQPSEGSSAQGATAAVTVITVGNPRQAVVESSAAEAGEEEQQRGLDVAVVQGPQRQQGIGSGRGAGVGQGLNQGNLDNDRSRGITGSRGRNNRSGSRAGTQRGVRSPRR